MPLPVVVGNGPGDAHAIAKRFGAEGCTVALVGRTWTVSAAAPIARFTTA